MRNVPFQTVARLAQVRRNKMAPCYENVDARSQVISSPPKQRHVTRAVRADGAQTGFLIRLSGSEKCVVRKPRMSPNPGPAW
jgi:hypothetical protein